MAIGPNLVDDCEGMTEEDYWRGMDEAMQDEEGDEPFCNCSAGHSIEETDWNQCDSCGKPIYDEEPAVAPAPTFRADEISASELIFPDRYELPRCNGCGHLLHAGPCVGVAPHNVEFSGTPAASSPEAPLERRVGGAT